MLAENEELLFRSSSAVFKNHYIIDTLMQLNWFLSLKCVGIKDEEIAVVAANPGQIIMH